MNYRSIFRSSTLEKFSVHASLNQNVGLLRLFPSITSDLVKVFLQSPIEGVVLQSYGTGNLPTNRDDIIKELCAATKRGVIIVNITQCATGCVSDAYEAGKLLRKNGTSDGIIYGYLLWKKALNIRTIVCMNNTGREKFV